jgi:predicted nucleic acid-binding protein
MNDAILIGIDTNVLIYANGYDDAIRQQMAIQILAAFGPHRVALPTQVIGEFYSVIVRKMQLKPDEAADRVRILMQQFTLLPAPVEHFAEAAALASARKLQFWDSLILVTSADAGCVLLLSEDLQDGFVYRGCTVANPFAVVRHPLLRDALERS